MVWFLGGKSKNTEGSVSLHVVDPREAEGHCMITGNLQIRGDVYFSGQLRVDGRIDGKVSTFDGGRGSLIVSKGAVINGPVNVTNLLVDGTLNGPVDVEEKLECRANAILRGRALYGSIHISDGAKIEAQCRQHDAVSKMTDFNGEGTGLAGLSLATRGVPHKSE
jgi:cytoskeletal protein CcmA (bactofilin family)